MTSVFVLFRARVCLDGDREGELCGECVEGDDEELKEGDEDACMRALGGKSLHCDCIAVKLLSLRRTTSFRSTAYLQQPPKTKEKAVIQSDKDNI